MSDISSQALRGRQKRLQRVYQEMANKGEVKEISRLIPQFLENLEIEGGKYDYIGIEIQYYPIFFDNLFRSMGFQMYAGVLPSISGTKPRYKALPHLVAIDSKRAILFGDNPKSLYAEIADIQPVCPLPIIGLCHYTWSQPVGKKASDFRDEDRRIATALGLGFLNVDSATLKRGIELSYPTRAKETIDLGFKLGLPQMLSLSVENLAVYGTFQASQRSWPFCGTHFVSMCDNSAKKGHELGKGELTKIKPIEAINDPEWFFGELGELDLIKRRRKKIFDMGARGSEFIRNKITSTPQEAALYNLSVNLRDEMKVGFDMILEQLHVVRSTVNGEIELFIDDIDSFSRVRNIRRSTVRESVASEDFVQLKLEEILGEFRHRKDWGGESCDLYSSDLRIRGKRYRAAFLLKGSGTKGKLTIAKCGKNGDQIQRLFKCPADVFVIQHISEIDEAVIEEAKQKTLAIRTENKKARFCIIDGLDTQRLVQAYSI